MKPLEDRIESRIETCAEAIRLMSAAIDRQASAAERTALDEHLARCASCAEQFAAEQEIDDDLRWLFAPRRDAAGRLAERVARECEIRNSECGMRNSGTPSPHSAFRIPNLISWLAAMAAGFFIAVLVFQPWKKPGAPIAALHAGDEGKSDEPAKTIVDNPSKVAAIAETPIARLVVATGDVTIRPAADADWSAVPPSLAAADFACRAGASVRTEPGVRCEMQTSVGCVIRMNDDSQVTVRSPRSLELHKGQVWCSAPDEVTMEVSTSVPPEGGPCGRGGPKERSWTFKGPNASLISAVNEKGNLRLTAAHGQVELRSGEAQRTVPSGQSVTINAGQIENAPYDEDALLAATWIDALLVRKGHANPELLARVDGLLAQIGRAKASFLYERELRGLGEHCVLPLLRFVQEPPASSDREQRQMAMRIIADLAPSWAVGDLIPLLSDGDAEVRYHAAAALRRLTGHSQGREPGDWRKPWTDCTPTFASWQTWWQHNRQRYPTPEFTKALPSGRQGATKKS